MPIMASPRSMFLLLSPSFIIKCAAKLDFSRLPLVNSSASNSNPLTFPSNNNTLLHTPTQTNNSTSITVNASAPSTFPIVSPPRTSTEMQKLSSDRIATYLMDPIHPLPQYKHNTTQASITTHVVDMLSQLEVLIIKIDKDAA